MSDSYQMLYNNNKIQQASKGTGILELELKKNNEKHPLSRIALVLIID